MSGFEGSWNRINLSLKDVFTIARGSKKTAANVFLTLKKDGVTGNGEAAPNTRYGESPELVERFMEAFHFPVLDDVRSIDELPGIIKYESERIRKETGLAIPKSGTVAIEMAWLDWYGHHHKKRVIDLLGYTKTETPVTSFTIGLDTPQNMQAKIRASSHYPIYKIKLGTEHDHEIISSVRQVTYKPLRVDANEGWTTIDQAKREIEYLYEHGVELVEQPMPAAQYDALKMLKNWSPVPLMADESFTGMEPLSDMADQFHVVNIKLMKMGSILQTQEVINEAHSMGLEVMIGCMIESTLAISAGAVIALDCTYCDLDGNLLIEPDPYQGLSLSPSARISLSQKNGFGVEVRN
ncbi:MAG: dipeptide epimerase [Bacteroidota bacterium]